MRPLALIPLLLTALLCGGTAFAAEAQSSEISPAEQLVFLEDHLSGVRAPTVLRYRVEETAPAAPKADAPPPRGPQVPAVKPGEQLKLDLKPTAEGGCCAVAAEDVGGEAFGYMPQIESAKANPVVLYFLERDIRRMSAATGGQSAYFRKQIRLALADHATVRDTTVRYGGRQIAAREVRVTPYADDPRRPLLGPLADKGYSFVFAAEAPGGIYQLRTDTPAPAAGAPPVTETVLTLAEPTVAVGPGLSVQERSQ
jgi:hypothetical protein